MTNEALIIQLEQARSEHILESTKDATYVDTCLMQSNDVGDIQIVTRHINFDVCDDDGNQIPSPKHVAKVIRAEGWRARG